MVVWRLQLTTRVSILVNSARRRASRHRRWPGLACSAEEVTGGTQRTTTGRGMRLVVATHGIWADDQLGWRKNRIRQFGVDDVRIGAGASVILARERMGSGGRILE
jgi:hypothetical protein